MECQRCGLTNAEAARFCPGCGNALSAPPEPVHTERPGIDGTLASSERGEVPVSALRAPLPPPPTDAYDPVGQYEPGQRDLGQRDSGQRDLGQRDLGQRPDSMRPSAPDFSF